MRLAALFVLGMAAEWFWSTRLDVWGLAPRLLLLLTVATASQAGPVAGQTYGFFWGLFLDALSAHTFGAGALALTLVGYLVGNLRRQMDVSSPTSQMMVAGVVSTAFWLFVGFAGLVFEHRFLWVGWKLFTLGTLYNVLVAPAAFSAVRRALATQQR
ncbi:MAG: rod shape-determining protein MreD [Elusimicrobiota bacterium]|jgi:rod shape-determining protein MreD